MTSHSNKLTFMRNRETGDVVLDADGMKAIYYRLTKQPGSVARAVSHAASTFIADEANKLKFSTPGRTYEEAASEVKRRYPEVDWLSVATIGNDDRFFRDLGIQVLDFEEDGE